MDAAARHSTSPDDCSDGADALSAPSEFLAEFLSAIMQRQYAEALKYCRLILQYEPHNATARGFFPLLQHKVQALKRNDGAGAVGAAAAGGGSSSGSSYSPHSRSLSHSRSRREGSKGVEAPRARTARTAGARTRVSRSRSASGSGSGSGSGSESGGSVASQSSLELDSSSASASMEASAGASGSASAGASDSRSTTRSHSDPDSSDARDDNGNLPDSSEMPRSGPDDVENDNDVSKIKGSSSSLRRLRAQFACSNK